MTFFGTASQFSTSKRKVNSLGVRLGCLLKKNYLLIESGEVWLVDGGDGISLQIAQSGYHFMRINKIFITHLHGDHVCTSNKSY